jgi:K+-transporting ATPase ATPase C chain
MRNWRPILGVSVGLWALVAGAYPLAVLGVAHLVWPFQANGSVIRVGGVPRASAHVGQAFTQPGYFWGRPSATTAVGSDRPQPYNPLNSGPSNLGPDNPALVRRVRARVARLMAADPGLRRGQIPPSWVEGSGSGLDPDIPVAAAEAQVPRVARATGLAPALLQALIANATHGPQFGVFGVRRVNVVALNLALYQVLHH